MPRKTYEQLKKDIGARGRAVTKFRQRCSKDPSLAEEGLLADEICIIYGMLKEAVGELEKGTG